MNEQDQGSEKSAMVAALKSAEAIMRIIVRRGARTDPQKAPMLAERWLAENEAVLKTLIEPQR